MTEPVAFDVIIIGGGPAGIAAANVLTGHGLQVAVIDEQQRPGGQIARQPPAAFRVTDWLGGRSYRPVKAALAAFAQSQDIGWHGGRSVIGLELAPTGFRVLAAGATGAEEYHANRVLLATGCYDLPVPRPGWTTPGVLSAGAIQAFLKSQQLLPAAPLVLAGTHPLMLLIAEQVAAAGGTIATLAFHQEFIEVLRPLLTAPITTLRNLPLLVGVLVSLLRLRRSGVRVQFGSPLMAIAGDDAVTGARFARAGAAIETVPCASVGLCYGFVPQSDLTRLVGAAVRWAGPAGGWSATHDAWMRASPAGLYVAGETVGIGGAASALAEGALAGLAILQDSACMTAAAARAAARPLWRQQRRQRRFAGLLDAIGNPENALALALPSETILCRCEDVATGTIDDAVNRGGSANAIKLATRMGMGLCQGRSCETLLLRRIARHKGQPLNETAGFTARFPVRPIRIGDLVSIVAVAPDAMNAGTDET